MNNAKPILLHNTWCNTVKFGGLCDCGTTTKAEDDVPRCPNGAKAIPEVAAEYTGGSVDYYTVHIERPTTEGRSPFDVECNDIIEALGMNYAEGNAFKAIWRRAAQRTLGKRKVGAKDDGLYDAEKVVFFGKRLVEQSKALCYDSQ